MNYTQRKELAKRGYTEERLQDFAKNQIVQIGVIVTPAALKKEGGKRVKVLALQMLHDLDANIKSLRGHTHIVMGIINTLADFALREAIDRIKRTGAFKRNVKKCCNSTQKALDIWKLNSKEIMAGMTPILEDLSTDMCSDMMKHFTSLRVQLHNAFGKHKHANPELASWIEAASIVCALSNFVLRNTMDWGKQDFCIDATEMFRYLDLSLTAGKEWQKLCRLFYPEDMKDAISNHDELVCRATRILAEKCLDIKEIARKAAEIAVNEYADDFDEQQKKDLIQQAKEIEAQVEEEAKTGAKANADYWAHKNKTAKPRTSDVTTEDIELLKQHFA